MKTGYHSVFKKRHAALIAIIAFLYSISGCGSTSLHRTIELGDTELAKKIISDDENLQKSDKNESTALHYAAYFGNEVQGYYCKTTSISTQKTKSIILL